MIENAQHTHLVDAVTLAIIKAFFDREPDADGNRVFSVSPADNEDLARAAIAAIASSEYEIAGPEEPYIPNENTVRIPWETWRALNRGNIP